MGKILKCFEAVGEVFDEQTLNPKPETARILPCAHPSPLSWATVSRNDR